MEDHTVRRAVVCLLLAAPSVVAAPAPLAKSYRDPPADAVRIQGEWDWQQPNGVERVAICDGYVRWRAGTAGEVAEAYRLHPTTTPKGIDLDGPAFGESLCIYALRGDTLVIRQGLPRWERPSSIDGDDQRLYVLRRRR
jgi:hypothetical protein